MTTVLVVEDDPVFRSSIARDLVRRGLTVHVATSADEALAQLEGTAFDVLVTDLRLGGRDGIDLLKRARTAAPRTRAVLMSGFATARDYQRAIELGAVRVLVKPFTSAELHQAIEHARDCSSGYSGSIHGLSLIDVLQLYQFARRSLALHVTGAGGRGGGQILLRDGAFVHAERGDLTGEPALVALLAAPSGVLRTATLPADHPVTIERPPQLVLLDCLRVLDEGALPEATPAPDEPDPAELARDRLRAHWDRLRATTQAPETADVIGVDLAAGTCVRLAGTGDPEPWAEPARALVAALRALGGAERGGAELALGTAHIAAVWSDAPQLAILAVDVAASPPASAWFRAFAHALAREQLTPAPALAARARSSTAPPPRGAPRERLQPQPGDRDGKDR